MDNHIRDALEINNRDYIFGIDLNLIREGDYRKAKCRIKLYFCLVCTCAIVLIQLIISIFLQDNGPYTKRIYYVQKYYLITFYFMILPILFYVAYRSIYAHRNP